MTDEKIKELAEELSLIPSFTWVKDGRMVDAPHRRACFRDRLESEIQAVINEAEKRGMLRAVEICKDGAQAYNTLQQDASTCDPNYDVRESELLGVAKTIETEAEKIGK